MPVVTNTMFTRLDDVVQYWKDIFDENADKLGLNNVMTYDEILITDYPCVLISPSPEQKVVHGTNTFLYTWRVFFYVFHADISVDRMQRNKADVQLAQRISDFIETDFTLADQVIFGYVETKMAGAVPAFVTNRGNSVVSTRLTWFAISEGRFK